MPGYDLIVIDGSAGSLEPLNTLPIISQPTESVTLSYA